MAEYLGDALFELRANVAPLRAGMLEGERIVAASTRRMQGELARGLGGVSHGLGRTGANLTRMMTVPILGIGAAAGKMAIDFQAAMENIHTQAGASQKEVDKLSTKVLALAKTVPFGPTPLADALYHLESIGLRLNKQFEQQGIQVRKQIPLMQVLKVAAQGAAVGHANLEQTTTALGSAWLSGIPGATKLSDTMGTLNAVVGTGNMRMSDLVTALGTGILPMAKLAGLSLKDVGAALAVFSDEGYPASSAATQMATALHYLYDPTKKATSALKDINISHTQLAQDMHKPNGLLVALTDLHDHLEKLPGGAKGVKAESVLGDIFPAGRGRVLTVLMNQLTNYQAKIGQVGTNQKKFGDDVRKTQETAAYKIHLAWASIQSDLTSFGEHVLPPLVNGVKGVAGEIDKVGKAFGKLSPATQKAIITGGLVVAAIGPAMRIAGFFMGGVSKLLSAATIAARLGGGQGWKQAFSGGAGTTTTAAAGQSLGDVAEMRVNQMIVAELVAKNIPGVTGASGGRVRGTSVPPSSVPRAATPAAVAAGRSVPEGYVYDPMLGRNVRVASAAAPQAIPETAPVARAPARYIPTAAPTSPYGVVVPRASGGRAFEQTLRGEMQAQEAADAAAAARAARQVSNYRPRGLGGGFLPGTMYSRFTPLDDSQMMRRVAAQEAVAARRSLSSFDQMLARAAQIASTNLVVPNMRTRAGLAGDLARTEAAMAAEARAVGITPNLAGAMARRGGRLTPEEAFARSYPGGRYGGPVLGAVTRERMIAEEEAAAARPGQLSRMGSPIASGARSLWGLTRVDPAAPERGSALGRFGGRLAGAGGIALMGITTSQMLGQMVPGKAGQALKNVGTFASVGASLGSLAGPEGAIVGGIGGAIIGGLKTLFASKSFGEKVAGSFSHGFGGPHAADLQKTVADATNTMHNLTTRTEKRVGPRGTFTTEKVTIDPSQLSPGNLRKYMAAAKRAGEAVAKQLEKGWKEYKFQSEPTMFKQLKTELHSLPPAAQSAAVSSAIQFSANLERHGKVAKGSTDKFIRQIENQFPRLSKYLGLQGKVSADTFTAALNFDKAGQNVRKTINDIAFKDFPQLQEGLKDTRGGIAGQSGRMIDDLKKIAKYGTGPMRRAAIADMKAIRTQWAKDMSASAAKVKSNMKDMKDDITSGSRTAADNAQTSFQSFASSVTSAMNAGIQTSAQGAKMIGQALNQMLVAFGQKPIPLAGLSAKSILQWQKWWKGGAAGTGSGIGHRARGGLMTIGRAGERGGDNVPLSMMVGRGEKVAVFNATHQAIMDRHLSRYGGLDGMFASNTQPHYSIPRFASGGVAFDGHPSNVSPGIRNLIGTMENKFPLSVTSTTDYTHALGSYHYKGQAVDMGGTPAVMLAASNWIKSSGLAHSLTEGIHNPNLAVKFGQIETPPGVFSKVWADHTNHIHLALTGLLGPAAQGAALREITAPRVTGQGTIPDSVRASLRMQAKAANQFAQTHMPVTGSEANTGVGGVIGMPNAGNWQGALRQIAAEKGWSVADWMWIVNAESSGDPEALNSIGAFGLGQFLGSTKAAYAKYGAASHDPVAQIRAMAMYIRDRYGNPTAAKAYHLGHNSYAAGGKVDPLFAATGLVGQHHRPGTNIHHTNPPHHRTGGTHQARPRRAPGQKGKGMTGRELGELTQVSTKVSHLEDDLTLRLGQYSALENRYNVDEGQPQYLNDDGSLNPAGVAKKIADDTDLLHRAEHILADYQAEVKPVTKELKKWLGAKSKTQAKIDADNKKIKILVNKLAGIKTADAALTKPMKDEVTPILEAETKLRNHWKPIIEAAVTAERRFHGVDPYTDIPYHARPVPPHATAAERRRIENANATERARVTAANKAGRARVAAANKSKRSALEDAVITAQTTENNAMNPLNDALAAARHARKKHANQTTAARSKLTIERTKLNNEAQALRREVSTLKGILTGSGGNEGDDKRISMLETIGGKLGVLEWSDKGQFLGINTKNQGAMFDEQTTIDSIKITLGTDASLKQPTAAADATSTTDDQATADAQNLAQYWQNIAMQNAQEAYVAEHQLGTLSGMAPFFPRGQMPPYAGSFAQGGIVPGPIGAPRTAIVHGEERITPPHQNSSAVHLHFADGMGWLQKYITATVEDSTRGMARRAARRMPSRGGGMVLTT